MTIVEKVFQFLQNNQSYKYIQKWIVQISNLWKKIFSSNLIQNNTFQNKDAELVNAVNMQDIEKVKKLLAEGANANQKLDSTSVLILAEDTKNLELIQLILDKIQNPTFDDIENALYDPKILELFLKKDNIDFNQKDTYGDSIFMEAILTENPQIVKMLLDSKKLKNILDLSNDNASILQEAIKSNNLPIYNMIVPLVPDSYFNLKKLSNGNGSLFYIFSNLFGIPNIELLKKILQDKRYDLNMKNERGKNVLMYAIENYANAEFIKAFLDTKKINLMDVDLNGDSILHFAASKKADVFQTIVAFAPPELFNLRNVNGDTPLLSFKGTVENDHIDLLKFMLNDPRFDKNVKSENGNTILWRISSDYYTKVEHLELLYPHIQDFMFTLKNTNTGTTPLEEMKENIQYNQKNTQLKIDSITKEMQKRKLI